MSECKHAVTPGKPAKRTKLRFFRAWVLLGVALVLFVVLLSLVPPQSLPDFSSAISDKVNHLLAYAAMMFWFGLIFRKRGPSFLLAAGFVLLGVALEYAQGSTGYRTFEYQDMAANGIGVVSGFFLSRSKLGGLLFLLEGFLAGRRDPPFSS